MALTYENSAALMTDAAFRGRIKVSCIKFADFILNEAATVPAHNARVRWANSTFQNPEQAAYQVQPPTVMDPAVQTAGAAITDAALQSAVEGVINKMI
jgi:hypothetical protein